MKTHKLFILLLFFTNSLYSQNCETNIEKLLANINELINTNAPKAIEKLNEVHKECLVNKDSFDVFFGALYHKLGYASYANYQDAQASKYFSLAIQLRSISPGYYSEPTANSFYLRSEANFFLENYEQARSDAESAIRIIEEIEYLKKDSLLARYYMSLAKVFRETGDYNNALTYQNKATPYILELKDPDLIIYLHAEKGLALYKSKKYNLAKKEYNQVKRLFEKHPNKYTFELYSISLSDLGVIYLEELQLDKSISSFKKALLLQSQSSFSDTASIINLYANLLNAYSKNNQLEQADSIFNVSLTLANHFYKDIPHQNVMSELYYFKAVTERKKKNYQQALKDHQTSIGILVPSFTPNALNQNPILRHQPTGDKIRLREALTFKAETYQQKYQAEQKRTDLEHTFKTYHTLDTLITETRQGFKAVESKYFLQQEIIPIYEQAIKVALELYSLTDDSYYKEVAHRFLDRNKAIVLLEGLQDKELKLKNIDSLLLVEESYLLDKYYNLGTLLYEANQSKDTSKIDSLQHSLFNTKRSYDLLSQQFKEEYPTYYKHKLNYYPNISIAAIQDKLASNRAVIEFFIGEQTIYTSTITKDQFQIESIPIPDNFEILCDSFISMTRGEYMDEERFSKIAFQLYDLLFSPSEPLIDGIDRLILIADDVLLKIPFDALLTDAYTIIGDTWHHQNIPYLFKKYALSQVYASSLLFQEEVQKKLATKDYLGLGLEYWDFTKPDTASIYQDSILQRAQGRLKHADDEVKAVKEIVGGEIRLERGATKEVILTQGNEYNILHLSTHGVSYEDAPLNSAVILSKLTDTTDHLLQVADIYTLDLAAKMVVLSACQTLAGPLQRGEGMRTLSRAFSYAGAPSLVASLWNINDFSTKEIIVDFFKELKLGQPKDIALQQAKIKYLNEVGDITKATPQYWAQMIVIGDTEALYPSNKWVYGVAIGGLLCVCFFFFRRNRKKNQREVVAV